MKPCFRFIMIICLVAASISGCSLFNRTATPVDPNQAARLTLSSLKQVNDFPLYTMTYYSEYDDLAMPIAPGQVGEAPLWNQAWGCSLFAALGDKGDRLYGRNFDWEFSPAMLLFTHPSNGYSSVSMVDLAYIIDVRDTYRLASLSIEERQPLLEAPLMPFDGMNEAGVAIGMAAVPAGTMLPDAGKKTIGSIRVIREVLDHAGSVAEAEAIFKQYNLNWTGGPTMHYMIADRSGQAILVEFSGDKMVVIRNTGPWLQATNFLVDQAGSQPEAMCERYKTISQRLAEVQGQLTVPAGLKLLSEVSQNSSSSTTQWSVVYNISRGVVHVVTGRQYDRSEYKASISDWKD